MRLKNGTKDNMVKILLITYSIYSFFLLHSQVSFKTNNSAINYTQIERYHATYKQA